jgi:hypothetical protein
MKYLLIALIFLHGTIHLLGLVKAFQPGVVPQLTQPISPVTGIGWGMAAVLFWVAAWSVWQDGRYTWLWLLVAVLWSQWLIWGQWQDARAGALANLILAPVLISGFLAWRFERVYLQEAGAALQASKLAQVDVLTEKDLVELPAPVQKYIRYSGAVGQPRVYAFKVCFKGKIRQDNQSPWMPLSSEQINTLATPRRLFFMKATMKNLPVAGYHRYWDAEAAMDIRLLSAFRVQYQSGREMNTAETVTFFNDMCCLAPATLIDSRIRWEAVQGDTVDAAFTVHGITIRARLLFNEAGQLLNFISQDRYAAQPDGSMRLLPWSTPLHEYREKDGRCFPGTAEAIYTYPEGDLVYANFQIDSIEYNPVRP